MPIDIRLIAVHQSQKKTHKGNETTHKVLRLKALIRILILWVHCEHRDRVHCITYALWGLKYSGKSSRRAKLIQDSSLSLSVPVLPVMRDE